MLELDLNTLNGELIADILSSFLNMLEFPCPELILFLKLLENPLDNLFGDLLLKASAMLSYNNYDELIYLLAIKLATNELILSDPEELLNPFKIMPLLDTS